MSPKLGWEDEDEDEDEEDEDEDEDEDDDDDDGDDDDDDDDNFDDARRRRRRRRTMTSKTMTDNPEVFDPCLPKLAKLTCGEASANKRNKSNPETHVAANFEIWMKGGCSHSGLRV